jgi:phi13 family phage major tail protein
MANKVLFGISNLYVATYTTTTTTTGDVVSIGTPVHIPGAVSFSPSESSDSNDFYADNIIYWSGYSNAKIEGDLEVAMFDDSFKKTFLGYKTLTNGGVASVKNPTKPNVFIAFEVDGDAEKRRVALYNCTLGSITRNYSTITETKEPMTETLPVVCIGDNPTGVTMATFKSTDAGYSSLFTSPAAPVISTT